MLTERLHLKIGCKSDTNVVNYDANNSYETDENTEPSINFNYKENVTQSNLLPLSSAVVIFNRQQNTAHRASEHYYCLDVWHHISKFIAPEDIGRFALICRLSAYVTSSAEFWKNMYKMYVYNAEKYDRMPEYLQRDRALAQRKGLRANVIRSLFYVYRPFEQRLHNWDPTVKNYCSNKLQRQQQNHDHKPAMTTVTQFRLSRLMSKEYLGKNYSNIIEPPRRKYHHRILFNNFFSLIPNYYFYVFKEKANCSDVKQLKRHGQRNVHIHESEEIYYNRDDNCVILFIKTMKKRQQIITTMTSATMKKKMVRAARVKLTNTLRSIKVQASDQVEIATRPKSRQNNHQYTNVTVTFANERVQEMAFYTNVIQMDVYNWWEPKYDMVYREEY